MSDYPVTDQQTVCVWAQIDPADTPRYIRATVFRPSGATLATLSLTDEGDGFFKDTSLLFNNDDFWKVKFEVFLDSGFTQRDDENYRPYYDYFWRSAASEVAESAKAIAPADYVATLDEESLSASVEEDQELVAVIESEELTESIEQAAALTGSVDDQELNAIIE